MKNLHYDLIWFLIAIVAGFSLLYLSAVYFVNENSPFYIFHVYITNLIQIIIEIFKMIPYESFAIILIIISTIIIAFFMKLRKLFG